MKNKEILERLAMLMDDFERARRKYQVVETKWRENKASSDERFFADLAYGNTKERLYDFHKRNASVITAAIKELLATFAEN